MALTGSTTREQAYNFFKARGLTDAGTFGLMANIDAESNFRPDNLQNTCEGKLKLTDAEYVAAVDAGTHDFVNDKAGFGLCQWTHWSRKKELLEHVRGLGVSIADTEGQLLFVVKEMTTSYTSLWQLLKTTTSIKEASDAVLTIYERPADMSDKAKERRAEIGLAFYEEHVNGSLGAVELSDDEMTMEEIQHLLAFLGYYKIEVDGLYGNMTREGTEKFQERFGGLAVDGLPGPKTQKALRHAVAYGMPERDNAVEDDNLIPDAPAPSNEWPGKYWSREEFRCRCGGKYCNGFPAEPDHDLVNILDIVRERAGRPGHRSSGLRCEVWNELQNGVADSRHKTGKAMDFRLEGHTAAQTLAIVRTVPGVRYCYDIDGTYVHVDVT